MIDVYSWATPNGHKIHIMLEECGLSCHVKPVNIGAGEQFAPSFPAISPNNKIPAKRRHIGCGAYSIADIAIFPRLSSWRNQGIAWVDCPHLKGWFDEIAAPPAVAHGVEVLADLRKPMTDDTARQVLVGSTQYQRH